MRPPSHPPLPLSLRSQEGEVLARLEVEKRQAIECENYELAKLKKLQIDERRMVIYRELGIGSLLEDSGVSAR